MNRIGAEQWAEQMNAAVTVCNIEGIIVYMNDKAVSNFSKYGGSTLIGKSIFDCHNPHSCDTIREMLANPIEQTYMIEKEGKTKLIRQFPWIETNLHKGIIEISFEIPSEIANNKRD